MGSGLIGGAVTTGTSFLAAAQQRKFIKQMYKHRYQYQMEDMRKAGLNPILSYSQAPPSGPGGGMAAIADMAGSMQSGAQAGESSARTDKVEDERTLLREQTNAARASADQSRAIAQDNYQAAKLKGAQQNSAWLRSDFYASPMGRAAAYGAEGGAALGIAGRYGGAAYGSGVFKKIGPGIPGKLPPAPSTSSSAYDQKAGHGWGVKIGNAIKSSGRGLLGL